MTATPDNAPRTGACAPWINGDDLKNEPWIRAAIDRQRADGDDALENPLTQEQVDAILAESAASATEALYALTAKRFAGKCGPVTVRPVARPVDQDGRARVTRAWSYGAVGSVSSMFMAIPAVVSSYGREWAPTCVLNNFPIREIVEVKIDGVIIPPDEYELRDYYKLVRIRPTPSFSPTERYGWPTSQLQDLPDDQFGTFSVTYVYGAEPGALGLRAAVKLAEALALPRFGDTSHYPERITSFSRQGVHAQVASIVDVLKTGGTGIYEVDLFIMTVNPRKRRSETLVWSPDLASNQRQPGVRTQEHQ